MKSNHPTFQAFLADMLQDENLRKEFVSHDLAFETAQMVIEARIIKGVTQSQLAKMAGTSQSSIARVENGTHLPSLSFLEKLATAFKTYLIPPKFGFMENEYTTFSWEHNINIDSSFFKPSDCKIKLSTNTASHLITELIAA